MDNRPVAVELLSVRERPVADADIESLLEDAYVAGGFTPPEIARTAFVASTVRARGEILGAWAIDEAARFVGMVIVVFPASPARRIARGDEAEIHLLAVSARYRGAGVGRRLVEASEIAARREGYDRVVLWTQPTMRAAQALYASRGFLRAPERDADIARVTGRTFLVYEKALGGSP